MEALDLITVGDAVIDCFLGVSSPEVRLDAETICVPHGRKMLVDSSTFALGGNACNVAVGAKRLGLSVGLCAEIGTDTLSELLLKQLLKEQIQLSLLQQSQAATSFAVGIQVKEDRVLFVNHVRRKHAFSFTGAQATWVYLTSLGADWQQAYEDTFAFAAKQGVRVAFSPGSNQLQEKDVVKAFCGKSTIVFCNKEEAQKIVETQEMNIKSVLDQLLSLGSEMVSITDGKEGAYYADKTGQYLHLPIFPAAVVEKTGAGDAYAAGFLAGLIHGKTPQEAMQQGGINAGSVIGKIGAQDGLLTTENMVQLLASHPEFQTKTL